MDLGGRPRIGRGVATLLAALLPLLLVLADPAGARLLQEPAPDPSVLAPPTDPAAPEPTATTVLDGGVRVTRNVVMQTLATDPPVVLTVDIYQPPDDIPAPEGGRPAIVIVHGGSWFQGAPINGEQHAMLVAEQGWVGFSVSYRLASEGRPSYPDAVGDVQRGVRWVAANATAWGAVPTRLAIVGSSAGGHLAAQVANLGTDPIVTGPLSAPPFTPPLPEPNPPAEVKVVATWSAPFVLTELVPNGDAPPPACGSGENCQRFWSIPIVKNLIGCELNACREAYSQASPVNRVVEGTTPMWMANADDEIVPLGQLQLMGDALARAGVDHQSLIIEGSDHADQFTDRAWNEMIPFVADRLGVAPPEPLSFPVRGEGPGGGFTTVLALIAGLVLLIALGIYALSTRSGPSRQAPFGDPDGSAGDDAEAALRPTVTSPVLSDSSPTSPAPAG